jgi:hypothetical protein
MYVLRVPVTVGDESIHHWLVRISRRYLWSLEQTTRQPEMDEYGTVLLWVGVRLSLMRAVESLD